MKYLASVIKSVSLISVSMALSQCTCSPIGKVTLEGGFKLPSASTPTGGSGGSGSSSTASTKPATGSGSGASSGGASGGSSGSGGSGGGGSASVAAGDATFTVTIEFNKLEDVAVCEAQKSLNQEFKDLYQQALAGKITPEQYEVNVKRLKEDGVEIMKQIASVKSVTETTPSGTKTTTGTGTSGRAVKLTGAQAAARAQVAISNVKARLQ